MARQLTANEQSQIMIESDAWYPTLFTTYGTPAVKMLANPIKVAIVHTVIYAIVASLYIKFMNVTKNRTNILIAVVIGLIVAGVSYYRQYMTNGNVIGLLPKLPENATKFDYLNNYAVQGDLYRGSGSTGGSFLAGALGGAAASKMRFRR
jgi:hypothetical protein